MSSIGKKINSLQQKIENSKKELNEISKLEEPIPEFINTTNLLRSNEYLKKSNEKKSELLTEYEEYCQELEKLILKISQLKGNLDYLKSRFKLKRKSKIKTKRAPKKKKPKKKSKRRIRKSKKKRV